jgi:hypothetical protein
MSHPLHSVPSEHDYTPLNYVSLTHTLGATVHTSYDHVAGLSLKHTPRSLSQVAVKAHRLAGTCLIREILSSADFETTRHARE